VKQAELLAFVPTKASVDSAMKQLEENQRILDYDTKEFTVELLVQKFGKGDGDIFVPPYQREFNWDLNRQSRFVESLLMGLPIPFLFFAELPDGLLEVVDGRQRLSTCAAFLHNDLTLIGLERLDRLDGFRFEHLSTAQQRRFRNRTIRSVVLSEKATDEDRRDLFDRINTGSMLARPAEIRRGSNIGAVTDLLETLAVDARFQHLCPMTEAARRTRQGEELVVRFLAFGDGLKGYRDRMSEFLNDWLRTKNVEAAANPAILGQYTERFNHVMEFVAKYFPHGFAKKASSTTTPRVRFDAIAIGIDRALRLRPELALTGPEIPVVEWLYSEEFFSLTTSSAANVRSRIENRTEYVTLMILGDKSKALRFVQEAGDDDDGSY
jgi:hypothetical protein